MEIFTKIEVFSCVFMTGVIWIIQLVHYPCFFYIERDRFKSFASFHQKNISFIVLPVMLLEIASNSMITFFSLERRDLLGYVLSGLLYVIWGITFCISVPCHKKLLRGYHEKYLRILLTTNWIRTLLWSSRCLLLFFIS